MSIVMLNDPAARPRVLWERSSEDRYSDPGTPVLQRAPSGYPVLQVTSKGELLLTGAGASAQGDRPFFDRLDIATGKSERVWRSDGEQLARVRAVIDDDGDEVLMSRETPTEPTQFHLVSLTG